MVGLVLYYNNRLCMYRYIICLDVGNGKFFVCYYFFNYVDINDICLVNNFLIGSNIMVLDIKY